MRRILLVLVVLSLAGALYLAERRQSTAPVGLGALMHLLADFQKQAERVPLTLTRVSDADEQRIGAEIAAHYGLSRAGLPSLQAEAFERYVNWVGGRLTGVVHRTGIRYRFHLDDSPQLVNAFALPGGHVVLGRGLMDLMESEDELAAVLGHEIAHVDRRHVIERLQYELAARRLGLSLPYALASLPITLFQVGYNKEQELEADRVGTALAVALGYSPQGAIDLFRRFQEKFEPSERRPATPMSEMSRVTLSGPEEYFRSHPPATIRIAEVEKEIVSRRWKRTAVRPPLSKRLALIGKGEILEGAGDFAGSVEHYRRALEADPSNVRLRLALARSELYRGQWEAAIRRNREAIQREPGRPEGWDQLAEALSWRPDQQSALQEYRASMAIALDPSREAKLVRAVHHAGLLVGAERIAEATREIESASRLYPDRRREIEERFAWWCYRWNKIDVASSRFLELWNSPQGSPGARLGWAWCRMEESEIEEARAHFGALSQTAATLPAGRSPRLGLSITDWKLGNGKAALKAFEAEAASAPALRSPLWIEHSFAPQAASALKTIGLASEATRDEREGRWSEAAAGYRNLSSLEPEAIEIQIGLSRTILLTGRIEEAVEAARKAVALQPKSFAAFSTLADALSWRDDRARGAKEFARMVGDAKRVESPSPDAAIILATVAGMYGWAGDELRAKLQLEEALRLASDAEAGRLRALLGWWYWRGGFPGKAFNQFQLAAGLGYREAEVGSEWARLEEGQLGPFPRLTGSTDVRRASEFGPPTSLGEAVGHWRGGRKEEAVRVYAAASRLHPILLNEAWLGKEIPPRTSAACIEMLPLARAKLLSGPAEAGAPQGPR